MIDFNNPNYEVIANAESYPGDIDLEYGLIGWVLIQNNTLNYVSYLLPKDFYSSIHADIWQAIIFLHKNENEITPFTIAPHLKNPEIIDSNGGKQYLVGSITHSLVYPSPIKMAKLVLDLSQKRQLIVACEDAALAVRYDSKKTAIESIPLLEKAIENITIKSEANEFESGLEVADGIVKDLTTNAMPYSTGLKLLDEAMDGGVYPGKSYGFAARKKVGKTSLAATLSGNFNDQKITHLFICGEMSPKEIHQRVLARMAGIYTSSFRNDYGKTNDCYKKISKAIGEMPNFIIYKNAPGITFEELKRICLLAVEKQKVRIIIVDYWQLIGGKQRGQSTSEHLDLVAQWIADFGRRHSVGMITMAQLNQDDNTRGGEGIRLAFDQLYQLHRDNLTKGEAWIEMMETRYTAWKNIGSKDIKRLIMMEKGQYFEEI